MRLVFFITGFKQLLIRVTRQPPMPEVPPTTGPRKCLLADAFFSDNMVSVVYRPSDNLNFFPERKLRAHAAFQLLRAGLEFLLP